MGSMLGPRGLEKLYADIIAQNECGFNHFKEGHQQPQSNWEMREK
jgi:hypothetical protein